MSDQHLENGSENPMSVSSLGTTQVFEPKPEATAKSKWPSPQDLPSALPPVPELSPEYIPPALAPWLQDVAERACIPIDYVAAPVVVALSGLIGRSVGI